MTTFSRVTAVGTQSSSDFLTAAEYNDAAGGFVFRIFVTSTQGSITAAAGSPVDLTGLTTGSWTTPANARLYRFWFDLAFSNTNAGEQITIWLIEDGSQIRRWDCPVSGNATETTSVAGSYLHSPSSGTHTYKLGACRSGSASGTYTLQADLTTRINLFCVEDIGPL